MYATHVLPLLSCFLTAKSSPAPTHLLVNRVGPCYDGLKTVVTTSEFGISTQTYDSSLSGELNISENVTDGWKVKVTMQKCVDIRNIDSCDYFRSFFLVRNGCDDEDEDEHYSILFHYADPIIDCPVQAGHYKIFNYPIFTEDNYLTVYESKISTSVFGYTFRLDGFTVDHRKMPTSTDEWLNIAKGFEDKWNFPHCVGALDGKHIQIQAPPNCGSYYYNYKGTHSIVLLALVDSCYKFIYVNIGCNGRILDGGVFNNCKLSRPLENNDLKLPSPSPLPGTENIAPYVIVADDAFALKPYLMKPYGFKNQPAPNRVFNFRLSRARNTVENVFGHIASRFRVLRRSIMLSPVKTRSVIAAICVLHNFLIETNLNYIGGRDDCSEQHSLLGLQPAQQTNPTVNAKSVRDLFRNYFVTPEGEINWQYTKI